MTTDLIKRIQSKAKANGFTVSRQQIRDIATQHELDTTNLTDDQVQTILEVIKNMNESTGLALISNSPNISVVTEPSKPALSTNTKQTLLKVEATEIGIELSESEITSILDSTNQQFYDSVDFLEFAKDAIKEMMVLRNTERQNTRINLVTSILDTINAANQEDAQNAMKANAMLADMVEQTKSQASGYINPYTANKQRLQEMLQARKQSV